MIGVDTDLLLRLLVNDNAAQHEAAKSFFALRSANDPAYISVVVISELAWVLTKRYGFSKDVAADLILALLQSPDLVVEKPAIVEEAAQLSRQAQIGFTDALISQLALSNGCHSVVTFDREAAKRIPGMELLA